MRKNLLTLLLGLSVLGNIFLLALLQKEKGAETITQKELPYLSKRIFVENQNDILINFIPLRRAIREYVEKPENKVGAYFEYLPSGTSIGANEKEEAHLASLSKVPLVMSIFKKIEGGKMLLNNKIIIKKEHLDHGFGNLWEKGEGSRFSVEELINLVLVESDNTAYNALVGQLTAREINEVYEGLDIELRQRGESLLVSPKSYSSIFRSLYLSSYLSEENSNRILEILTKTPFNDKIDAGVPDNIKVSHKIGVFERLDASQDVFIDCGIVYAPNRPYILCIFVKDTNEQAQKHMSEISKMVYEYIKIVNPKN